MTALALKDSDFYFTNYRLTFTTSNSEEILQRVKMRLRFFQGEWFLDTAHGIPYYQEMIGKKPANLNIVSQIFNDAILEVEGVLSMIESIIDIDNTNRKILYSFKAQIEGDIIQSTIPFNI